MVIHESAMLTLFNNTSFLVGIITIIPLIYFFILIFWQTGYPRFVSWFATSLIGISTILSIIVFIRIWGNQPLHLQWQWFSLDNAVIINAGILINDLSAMLLFVVNFISFLVHLYSIEYKKGDKYYQRYFAYLGLFTFSMLIVVISDNLLTLFMGWELVGFSSYLLIGFWFDKIKAIKANFKAFIVNRAGDAGFVISLMIIWAKFGTFNFLELKEMITLEMLNDPLITIAGIGLFFGCAGKSAQVPLHLWLPDAMEGPTPISALIHAATMVAAGVFLLARIYFMLDPVVLMIIAFTGAISAFTGAFSALTQTDIKRVLAFSTISQLGYMMMAIGVGAFSVAIFHLITHAFFKACLFLSAGSVIHSMGKLGNSLKRRNIDIYFDKQNMRIMGGLWNKLPVTFITFLISGMALAGVSLFSGFLSKDAILFESWQWAVKGNNPLLFIVPVTGFLTALLTAFYVGRQIIIVFFGDFRLGVSFNEKNKIHEAPFSMLIPQILLAILSIFIFFSFNPLDATHGWILSEFDLLFNGSNSSSPGHHWGIGMVSTILTLTGLYVAFKIFNPKYYDASKKESRLIYSKIPYIYKLSYFNFYIDRFYNTIIVQPFLVVSQYITIMDRVIIDGLVNLTASITVFISKILSSFERNILDGTVNRVAGLSRFMGNLTASIQNGNIQQYFIWSLLGIAFIILMIFLF